MKKELEKNLELCLTSNLTEYANLGLTGAEKMKALTIIGKEINLLSVEHSAVIADKIKKERHEFDLKKGQEQIENDIFKLKLEEKKVKIDRAKLKLEERKVDNDNEINLKKIELEESKINNDNNKLNLEIEKFNLDREKFNLEFEKFMNEKIETCSDKKRDKKMFIINTLMKVFEIGLPLALYTVLTLMNLRLIYKDDGRVTPELKELIRMFSRK